MTESAMSGGNTKTPDEGEQVGAPCPHCAGTGFDLVSCGWLMIPERTACRECKGTGKVLPRKPLLPAAWRGAWAAVRGYTARPHPEPETGTYRTAPKSEIEQLRDEINDAHARYERRARWHGFNLIFCAFVMLLLALVTFSHVWSSR